MSFDTTDKHLVFLLDLNARAPLTVLATQLKLSREAVNYRIKRLFKTGVINSFLTKLSFDKLGLVNYIAYLKLNNLDPTQYGKFVEELTEKKCITWIASLGGSYDLAVEMSAPGISQFDRDFSDILDEHDANIDSYHVSTRILQHSYGRKYLWPEKTAEEMTVGKAEKGGVYQIDGLDRKIISALASDARMSTAEISQRIKQAPSTVSFRLRQLVREGIIEGYTTLPNIQSFGYSGFKMLLNARNFSRKEEKRLETFCRLNPNVYYYTKTLGSWNYEVEVDVKDSIEYQQFLIDFRGKFGSFIQNIESLSIFKEHKWTFWPG
jgi:Lrp/AsnC family transcriptional regulator